MIPAHIYEWEHASRSSTPAMPQSWSIIPLQQASDVARLYVNFGSEADIAARLRNVRFTANSVHQKLAPITLGVVAPAALRYSPQSAAPPRASNERGLPLATRGKRQGQNHLPGLIIEMCWWFTTTIFCPRLGPSKNRKPVLTS
jgi:hypothetical protein